MSVFFSFGCLLYYIIIYIYICESRKGNTGGMVPCGKERIKIVQLYVIFLSFFSKNDIMLFDFHLRELV